MNVELQNFLQVSLLLGTIAREVPLPDHAEGDSAISQEVRKGLELLIRKNAFSEV